MRTLRMVWKRTGALLYFAAFQQRPLLERFSLTVLCCCCLPQLARLPLFLSLLTDVYVVLAYVPYVVSAGDHSC